MPTGVEEVVVALGASVVAAAQAAATIGLLSPASPPVLTSLGASDAAALGRDLVMDPLVFEGAPAAEATPVLPSAPHGAGVPAPVAGDRPPPSAVYGEPMDEGDGGGRGRSFLFEPVLIQASPARPEGPAAAVAPVAAGAAAAPPAPGPSPSRAVGEIPPPDGEGDGGEEPSEPGAGPAPLGPPPPGSEEPPASVRLGAWIRRNVPSPSDWADAWEANVTWTPSALLFGASGEEVSEAVKGAVAERFNDWLSSADPEESAPASAARVTVALTTKTVVDVVADVIVVPLLDPGTAVRGPLRLGAASGVATHQLEEGKIALGASAIVGEVSSAILMVAGAKSLSNGLLPRTGRVTYYAEGIPVRDAHSVIEVRLGKEVHRSHVVDADGTAQAREYYQNGAPARPDPSLYLSTSRTVSAAAARKMIDAMLRAETFAREGVKGAIGPYGAFEEHCATYVSSIAAEGGVVTLGRLGTHISFAVFAAGRQLAVLVGATAGPDAPRADAPPPPAR